MILAILLAFAAIIGCGRILYWQRGAPPETRSRGWRLGALLILQPLWAGALYLTLVPPRLQTTTGTLVIATRGAPRIAALTAGDHLVALPEAPSLSGGERVPDLATALRRHPGVARLHIIGEGLEARDRDAARGTMLTFDAAALPHRLVRIDAPPRIAAGAAFRVGGRVNGVAGGSAELIDPAGRRVDALALSASGDFVLTGTARAPGLASFKLRVRDAQHAVVEEAEVPTWTAAEPQPRMLLVAGAPGPEPKYLRRWATDAGLALHSQLSTGGGVELGDVPLPLNAATLQRFDMVVLDERSWAALSAGEHAALIDAVRGGLGLLLRVTGPLPDAVRRQWQALGFAIGPGGDTASLQLPAEAVDADALRARRGAGTRDAAPGAPDENPILNRVSVKIGAADAVPLLRDAKGDVLANWRAEGRGRIGLWTVTDSFGLVLSGHKERYGEYWSDAFATLARAQPGFAPRIEGQPREGQRMAICDLASNAHVAAPNGRVTALLVDPSSGASACAGYWPDMPGWHAIRQTVGDSGEQSWPFFVVATGAIPGLLSAELRDATTRLLAESATGQDSPAGEPPSHRGSSWPWLLAWLIISAILWWLERARAGRIFASPSGSP